MVQLQRRCKLYACLISHVWVSVGLLACAGRGSSLPTYGCCMVLYVRESGPQYCMPWARFLFLSSCEQTECRPQKLLPGSIPCSIPCNVTFCMYLEIVTHYSPSHANLHKVYSSLAYNINHALYNTQHYKTMCSSSKTMRYITNRTYYHSGSPVVAAPA
jgi:hypothetical protein